MTEEELYGKLVCMIGTMHTLEHYYWSQKWLNKLTMEEAEGLLIDVKNAAHHLAVLRSKLNHLTMVGEPLETELTTPSP
jgi:hypothetical protein